MQDAISTHLKTYTLFGNLKISKMATLEKTRAEKSGDPFNKLLNILNVGSISPRKHELEIMPTKLVSWNLDTWKL